jgi:hypothetical protein
VGQESKSLRDNAFCVYDIRHRNLCESQCPGGVIDLTASQESIEKKNEI